MVRCYGLFCWFPTPVLLDGFSWLVLRKARWPKMHIPHDFIRYFIRKKVEKADTAVLRSPLGKSWHVKVHGNFKDMYFGEGWQDFAVAHDLSVGFLLVFKYKGNMEFKVTIFDLSACEKEYNPFHANCSSDIDRRPISGSSEQLVAEHKKFIAYLNRQVAIRDFKPVKKVYETRSCCSLGPHFKAIIKHYNLKLKPYMNVPTIFQASYSLSSKRQVILRDPQWQLWPVRLYHRRRNTMVQTHFGSGWREFHMYNNLKEGDTCIFEIIPEDQNDIMHVHIFRK
uniref:B3 domain-containing protein Os03g0212300 isoform X2 n=1 Tax=Elaeis guineensis var. tenera TaxID=51953 RepID=A0A8N4IC04_ELAGV|nr:B3 domain-containing protein Os03g0212300 isoform X2 [Elaeis guineensis]